MSSYVSLTDLLDEKAIDQVLQCMLAGKDGLGQRIAAVLEPQKEALLGKGVDFLGLVTILEGELASMLKRRDDGSLQSNKDEWEPVEGGKSDNV